MKLSDTRPFVVKEQDYMVPKKSLFNRIIADGNLELRFAGFLEGCEDIISYAKNYLAVRFKLDYVKADGNISNYYPDFIVKKSNAEIYIIETKGRQDLDAPHKMRRLRQWCEDLNGIQSEVKYAFIFVDEEGFDKYKPKSFSEMEKSFREYRPAQD